MNREDFDALAAKVKETIPEYKDVSLYCIHCGAPILHRGAELKYYIHRKTKRPALRCINDKMSFISKRVYNSHEYHLCTCYECLKKKFSERDLDSKKYYLQPMSEVSRYAFNISDEDWKDITKGQSRTLESKIALYGEDEGKKRWEEYRKRQSYTNTFEYKKDKYGWDENKFKTYNLSRAVTLSNLTRKYGEDEGKKRWEDYCRKQRETTSLEYFIERYGEDAGTKKFIAFEKARTSYSGCSKIANKMCKEIHEHFKGNDVYYDELNFEFPAKGYRLDYYDKTLNIGVEFYGDFWHANPLLFDKDQFIKMHRKDNLTSVAKIWANDRKRLEKIENELRCKVLVVWEHDYKNNHDETMSNLIRTISSCKHNDKTKT